MSELKKPNRISVRFPPDPGSFALVKLPHDGTLSNSTTPALIINESFGGCSLLLVTPAFLNAGMQVQVQVGKLKPMEGEIRWVVAIENEIKKIGIQYKA